MQSIYTFDTLICRGHTDMRWTSWCWIFVVLHIHFQANNDSAADGPSTSVTSAPDAEALMDDDDDDDELDMDELNELEASLGKTSIQI